MPPTRAAVANADADGKLSELTSAVNTLLTRIEKDLYLSPEELPRGDPNWQELYRLASLHKSAPEQASREVLLLTLPDLLRKLGTPSTIDRSPESWMLTYENERDATRFVFLLDSNGRYVTYWTVRHRD